MLNFKLASHIWKQGNHITKAEAYCDKFVWEIGDYEKKMDFLDLKMCGLFLKSYDSAGNGFLVSK